MDKGDLTNRGTYVLGGSEFSVANQLRLKPGMYARVKDSGELEAHVNVKPGTGPSFRVMMEPQTGLFRLNVGQSSLKLYPILRSMGVTDKEIEKHWGPELLAKNMEAADPRAVARAFSKLVYQREQGSAAQEATKEAEISPLITLAESLDDLGTYYLMHNNVDKKIKTPESLPGFTFPPELLEKDKKQNQKEEHPAPGIAGQPVKIGAAALGGPDNSKVKADPKQLEMGMEVEKEHTPKKEFAEQIARDHLAEIGDYYTRLKKMGAWTRKTKSA